MCILVIEMYIVVCCEWVALACQDSNYLYSVMALYLRVTVVVELAERVRS